MTMVSQNYNNLINKHILKATSNIAINSYDDVFHYARFYSISMIISQK